MKTSNLILYGFFIVIIGFMIYSTITILGKDNPQANAPQNLQAVQGQDQQYRTITTGTTESGDVEIALTPQWREGKLYINMAVNTHSVDLSQFDLRQITTLKYDNKEIKSAKAPSLSGHHSNSMLVFDVAEQPNTFTVVMRNIPVMSERVFQW